MQNDTLGLIRVKGFLDENNKFIDKTFFLLLQIPEKNVSNFKSNNNIKDIKK